MTKEQQLAKASSYYYLIFLDAYVHDGKMLMCNVLTTVDMDKMTELKRQNPEAKVFDVTKRYDKFCARIADGTLPKNIIKALEDMPKIDWKMSQELKKDTDVCNKILKEWKVLVDFDVEKQ